MTFEIHRAENGWILHNNPPRNMIAVEPILKGTFIFATVQEMADYISKEDGKLKDAIVKTGIGGSY